MSIKYVHTNIISANWKSLSAFYQNVFQCIPVPPTRNHSGEWLDKGTGLNNAHLQAVHLQLPGYGSNGPTLEIYQYSRMEDKPTKLTANRKGFGHIAFLVDDVKSICDTVLENGGQYLGEITKKEVPGVGLLTFVYMTDPEGNIVEIQNWA